MNNKQELTNQLMKVSREKNKLSLKLQTKEWLKFIPRKQNKQTKHLKKSKEPKLEERRLLRTQLKMRKERLMIQ